MYLPTSLPTATEWALRRRSDRLLATCFLVSLGVHIGAGLLALRIRWNAPAPPAPRVTEVRFLKRPPPGAPPQARSSAPQLTRRPRDLSLYLSEKAIEPKRRRSRRSRRRARVRETPPAIASLPLPTEAAQRDAGGPTDAPAAPPNSRLSLPGPEPAGSTSGGSAEQPRPVPLARRGERERPLSALRPEAGGPLPPTREQPLPAPGLPAEREPVAARGAARRGEGPVAKLPDLSPGDDAMPRAVTGPDREPGGVPEAAPVSRAGERPRRPELPAETLAAGRPETSVPDATEPSSGDLPDPSHTAVVGADEARAPARDRLGAGRTEGTGSRADRAAERRRVTELPALSRVDPGAQDPGGRTASGEPESDGDAPRSVDRGRRPRRRAGDTGATGIGDVGTEGKNGDGPGRGAPDGPAPGDGRLPGEASGPLSGGAGEPDGPAPGAPGGEGLGWLAGPSGASGGVAGKGTPGGVYVSTTGRYLLPGAVTGSNYMFHVDALNRILDEINSRTKLQVSLGRQYLRIAPGGFKRAPVVVFTGHRAFTLNDEQRLALRQYVEGGGMLWADLSGGAFDESFRDEMAQIFGKRPSPLSSSHTIYRAFYVLDQIPPGDLGGRAAFEGITLGDRLAVVLTPNRYFAAVGGPPRVTEETQEGALRVAVNIYVYAAAHYRAETE